MDQVSSRTLLQHTLGQFAQFKFDSTRIVVNQRHRSRDDFRTRPVTVLSLERTIDACEYIHRNVFGHFDTRLRDTVGTRHGILEELDNRSGGTRTDDVTQHRCQDTKFSRSRNALRHVHIHLISIKVCVIGSSCGYIQTEGRIR